MIYIIALCGVQNSNQYYIIFTSVIHHYCNFLFVIISLYATHLTCTNIMFIANLGGHLGLFLSGSFISLIEPIVYFLLTPFRRAHQQEIKKKNQAKSKAETLFEVNRFQKCPPASKLFKRVPLDKQLLKKWQEINNITRVYLKKSRRSE